MRNNWAFTLLAKTLLIATWAVSVSPVSASDALAPFVAQIVAYLKPLEAFSASLFSTSTASLPTRTGTEPSLQEPPTAEGGAVPKERTFDLDFDGIPLKMALQTLARLSGVNLTIASGDELKVNANLRKVTVRQALEVILKPLGLDYRLVEGVYVVGTPEQLARWDPPKAESPAPVSSAPQPIAVEIYTVRFVEAGALLTTLQQVHPEVKVLLGVPPHSPRLQASESTGGEGMVISLASSSPSSAGEGGGSAPTTNPQETVRTLLLMGAPDKVAEALQTAQRLDQAPLQIRIEVTVSDMSRNALKELGLDYNWSKLTVQEIIRNTDANQIANETKLKPSDQFTFWRAPLSLEATLKALEQRGVAKLLANPSISVLNGESAQILIGERVLYPVVAGTTSAGTPLFDVREQNVGIVLFVRAFAEPGGTITLDIYPQVSVITGFLRVGESSLPQISTRELRTKIRVREGSSIAVGGLIREEEVRTLAEVPFLSKLPLLGELFKSRRRSTTQNELVIFLKPEIIRE